MTKWTNRETIRSLTHLWLGLHIPYYERAWKYDGSRNPKVIRPFRKNMSIIRELYESKRCESC